MAGVDLKTVLEPMELKTIDMTARNFRPAPTYTSQALESLVHSRSDSVTATVLFGCQRQKCSAKQKTK
jgi:hypothetical protein